MAVVVTHSKTLVSPDSGTDDKIYGSVVKLLTGIDDLNKMQNDLEMREAMTVYLAYRELH